MNKPHVKERAGGGSSHPFYLMRYATSLLDRITRYALYLSASILAAIVVLYCMEIALRYFFLAPTVWSRDTVTYLLCASIMMAAPEVARTNGHVAITIAIEMCSEVTRVRIETFLAFVTSIVSLGVCWVTAGETIRLYNSGILTLGTVPVPKWWMSAFIPAGFLLIGLQYLALATDRVRRGNQRNHI